MRSIALEKKLVSVSADLSPDRHSTHPGGQAHNLYSELAEKHVHRNKPDNNALLSVERLQAKEGKLTRTAPRFHQLFINARQHYQIWSVDMTLREVIDAFWRGHEQDNETLKSMPFAGCVEVHYKLVPVTISRRSDYYLRRIVL
ncbi:BREX system ATP-binding domain-containing protein [Klebsiella pneumoniae]